MGSSPAPEQPTQPSYQPATAPPTSSTDYTLPAAQAPTQLTLGTERDSLTGQVWGDFEVGPLLGRGGMGAVYRGRQRSLDRTVAIKVLPPHLSENADFRNRFEREAKSVAGLDSPHIIKVYGAGQHGGHHFFAMEYVDGHDLAATVKHGGRPPRPRALDWVTQAARGLTAASELGIVHRDIKPANLMLTAKGVVKIMDFGLVRSTKDSQGLTMTGTVMGTVSYFSPEQGRGEVCDCRTDLYALGVVMYELLTGRLPFTGEDPTSIIYQHIHVAPPAPRSIDPAIPEDWQAVCLKCLQKSADDRYASASDLLADLERLTRGEKPHIAPTELARLRSGTVLIPSDGTPRRRLAPWILVAATVTVAALTAILLARRDGAPEPLVRAAAATPRAATTATVTALPTSAPMANASANPTHVEQERAGNTALDQSEAALTSGDLTTASAHLSAAKPLLSPTAPRLHELARRIEERRIQAVAASRSAVAHIEAGQIEEARLALDQARRLAPIQAEVIEAERAVSLGEQRRTEMIRIRDGHLAEAETALRDADLDRAESSYRSAQQLDARHPATAAGLKAIVIRRERIAELIRATEAALTNEQPEVARQRLADLRSIAPRQPQLATLNTHLTNMVQTLAERQRAAEERERTLARRAEQLLQRCTDPQQPISQLEADLSAWHNDAGGERSETSAIRTALALRHDQAAVIDVFEHLDRAVLSGDETTIRALVSDRTFADNLISLSTQPQLVFVSSLRALRRSSARELSAQIDIRNAFATFPETVLAYDVDMVAETDTKLTITAAHRK